MERRKDKGDYKGWGGEVKSRFKCERKRRRRIREREGRGKRFL